LIGCRCQFLIGKTPWPPPLGQKRSDALIVTGTQGASQIHVARSHNLHPHFRRSRRRLAVGSMDWWPRERRLHFRHCLRDRGSLHCALRNYCRNWIGDFQCIQRQIVRVGIIAIPNCQKKIETAGKRRQRRRSHSRRVLVSTASTLRVLQSRAPLRRAQSQRRGRGANSHSRRTRPPICVWQLPMPEAPAMVCTAQRISSVQRWPRDRRLPRDGGLLAGACYAARTGRRDVRQQIGSRK
jgi:hypothetical protein